MISVVLFTFTKCIHIVQTFAIVMLRDLGICSIGCLKKQPP